MDQPLASIVIPCYRGERYLPEAIESCLRQTERSFEVIVVDDASPDGCSAVAERYAAADPRVRLLRHPHNLGVSEAFNTGFRQATGQYFARLAQDDLFREDALAFMLDHIRQDLAVGLVYCDMQMIDSDGKFLTMLPAEEPERALLPCDRVGLCVLWTRAAWEAVGPFDSRYDAAEDYEFFLRLSRRYRLAKCNGQAPFYFRYHAEQGGVQLSGQQDYAYALAQAAHHQAVVMSNPLRLGSWRRLITSRFRAWKLKRAWARTPGYLKHLERVAARRGGAGTDLTERRSA